MNARKSILCCVLLVLYSLTVFGCRRPGPRPIIGQDGDIQKDKKFVVNACGLCGQAIDVTIILRNRFQGDFFEHSITVTGPQRELIYLLQQAATKDRRFRFAAEYHGSLGYMITSLNKLQTAVENKTYWQIAEHPSGNSLNLGVSSYIPNAKEVIVFNFTTWATADGH